MKKTKIIIIILFVLLLFSLFTNLYLLRKIKTRNQKLNINKTFGGGAIDGKEVMEPIIEEYITIMEDTQIYLYRQNEPMKKGNISYLASPNIYKAKIEDMTLYIVFEEDYINVIYNDKVYKYQERSDHPMFLGQGDFNK